MADKPFVRRTYFKKKSEYCFSLFDCVFTNRATIYSNDKKLKSTKKSKYHFQFIAILYLQILQQAHENKHLQV